MNPQVTVLICTYDRVHDLERALDSVLAQELAADAFEVLVVDNNSSDGTRGAVESRRTAHPALRYAFESRQGKPYALNRGLEGARGGVLMVLDDDQLMPPGYLAALVRGFQENPDASFIGGKVLPIWEEEPPVWLTPDHWAPLGMQDYGPLHFRVDRARPRCLITCAYRVADLRGIGAFAPRMFVSEDAEVQARLLRAGKVGLYLPELILYHRAPAHRLKLAHFLHWHERHGRSIALMRDPAIEQSRLRLLDTPGHLFRAFLNDTIGWLNAVLRADGPGALRHRLRLCFVRGFIRERLSERLRTTQ